MKVISKIKDMIEYAQDVKAFNKGICKRCQGKYVFNNMGHRYIFDKTKHEYVLANSKVFYYYCEKCEQGLVTYHFMKID